MPQPLSLTKQKFGRLLVIIKTHNNKHGKSCWLCKCDCGKTTTVVGSNLRNGNTKSCGCFGSDTALTCNLKHGHRKNGKISKVYNTWLKITQRCTNPNDKDYPRYGGRGIYVCNRWRKFENFLEDMGKPPTNKHSIDRIDNNGNYCKSNCRWATAIQQQRNTHRNRLISFDGKTQCVAAWSEEMGINESTIRYRLNHNWSAKKALIAIPDYNNRPQ